MPEVHPVLDADIARVMVKCPVEDHGAMPLGQFLETEIKDGVYGRDIVGSSVEDAQELINEGLLDKEKAIRITLGSFAVKDEAGEIVRAPIKTAEPAPENHFQPQEAEKK